jgi:heme iron utilization protein
MIACSTMSEPNRSTFDGTELARALLQEASYGTLGTVDSSGAPFTSLVVLARDDDGCPIIITSHLSGHTIHLEHDGRIALLVASVGKGDPLAHPRLTLTGKAKASKIGDPLYEHLRTLYLRQNPKAQLYVDLPGFWFWRLEPDRAALNGGFGKAWSGTWAELVGERIVASNAVTEECARK